MKLVFIYGAPATGKLTIGRELAAQTGYKLHHNHMAVDLGLALFNYEDPNLVLLCGQIDMCVFKIAAAARLAGLVFTFAYSGPTSDPFIQEVIKTFDSDLYFVHLSCDVAELRRRVKSEDRRKYRKVTDPDILMGTLEGIDYTKDIAHYNHLAIGTTDLPPANAARQIADYFGLPYSDCT